MGISQDKGCHFGGPHNKDYSILGSICGSSYCGKLTYRNYYKGLGHGRPQKKSSNTRSFLQRGGSLCTASLGGALCLNRSSY